MNLDILFSNTPPTDRKAPRGVPIFPKDSCDFPASSSRGDFALASLISLFIFSPFSQFLFVFSFGYIVEIPILIISIFLLIINNGVSTKFLATALRSFSIGVIFLLPFSLLGGMSGSSFSEIYPDFRAMLALSVSLAILSEFDDLRLRSFVMNTTFLSFSFWLFYLKLDEYGYVVFREDSTQASKFFFPLYLIAAGTIAQIEYKIDLRIVFSFAFAIYIASLTSYRLNYIVLFLCVSSLCLSQVFYSKRRSLRFFLLFFFLFFSALSFPGVFDFFWSRDVFARWILDQAETLERFGAPHDVVFQLLNKTAYTLISADASPGDSLYKTYFLHLLDLPRFIFPHGLGQAASYGDPVIWGGNTLDNSIIFINYHFSFFVTFVFLYLYARWSKRFIFSKMNFLVISRMLVWLGITIFLYMRAWPFVAFDGAIGFAMVLAVAQTGSRRKST